MSDHALGERPELFTGAVLTGGSSVRMGTDKAFVVVRGAPLCTYPRKALVEAGARRVLAVGGRRSDDLRALGFEYVADRHPGQGPLGGVLTALEAATHPIVVVLACDLPEVDAAAVRGLVASLRSCPAAAAVPFVNERRQLSAVAYRRSALPALAAAFETGLRSLHHGLASLDVVEVEGLAPVFEDLDDAADLYRYASGDP